MSFPPPQVKKSLPPSRQREVVQPAILQFTRETPVEIIADKLRDDGFYYEADWMLRHPRYVAAVRAMPTPEERARREAEEKRLEEERKRRYAEQEARMARERAERRAWLRENRNNTDPDCPYRTIKSAVEAGFRHERDDEYGGVRWKIRGRVFTKDAKRAKSRTEWDREGFRVLSGAEPHCYVNGRRCRYAVYRDDQIVPKRKVASPEPRLVPVLSAVFSINRRAKRYRNQASSLYFTGAHSLAVHCRKEKEYLYYLKGQALHYLVADGTLAVCGHHIFAGGCWAELLRGEGYVFHRPCAPQEGVQAECVETVESKPKESGEPRLKDALFTIKKYLEGKPTAGVYEWPQRPRVVEAQSHDDYDFDDYEDFDDFEE